MYLKEARKMKVLSYIKKLYFNLNRDLKLTI